MRLREAQEFKLDREMKNKLQENEAPGKDLLAFPRVGLMSDADACARVAGPSQAQRE